MTNIKRGARFMALVAWLLASLSQLSSAMAADMAILLAETVRGDIDVTAYLVSEKLDGVRAIWDGKNLRHRSGRPVTAPAWFLARLPADYPLDGELWLGRGRFDELSGIVRKAAPIDDEWRKVRYMIFEQPGGAGSFADRIEQLNAKLSRGGTASTPASEPMVVIEQFRLPDRRALDRKLRDIVRAGGEGLMLHRADAAYVTGRSDVLLKLKPWHDTEAEVIGYEPGRGKYRGQVGALRMKMPAEQGGKYFRLASGLSDHDRLHPPPLGSLITYRYTELTAKGVPRFPRYWRVREAF